MKIHYVSAKINGVLQNEKFFDNIISAFLYYIELVKWSGYKTSINEKTEITDITDVLIDDTIQDVDKHFESLGSSFYLTTHDLKLDWLSTLIKELSENKEEYDALVEDYEKKGTDNLNYEETEYYGAYLGKIEILENILIKLKKNI